MLQNVNAGVFYLTMVLIKTGSMNKILLSVNFAQTKVL